jgi:hypothetical protein
VLGIDSCEMTTQGKDAKEFAESAFANPSNQPQRAGASDFFDHGDGHGEALRVGDVLTCPGEYFLHVRVEHMPEVLAVSSLLSGYVGGLVQRLPERHLVGEAVRVGGQQGRRELPVSLDTHRPISRRPARPASVCAFTATALADTSCG